MLSTHKDNKNFLFCRLTGAKIPQKKTAINKHIESKKFQRRFKECNFLLLSKDLEKMEDLQKKENGNEDELEEEDVEGEGEENLEEEEENLDEEDD